MKRIIFIFIITLYSFNFIIYSKELNSTGLLSFYQRIDNYRQGYNFTADIGSHVTGFGLNIYSAFYEFLDFENSSFSLGSFTYFGRFTFNHYENYYGLNKRCEVIEYNLTISHGFGPRRKIGLDAFIRFYPSMFNVFYGITHYISTDGTTQLVGHFGFDIVFKNSKFKFIHENDLYAFMNQDQFRTAAGEIEFLYLFNNLIVGIASGFKIWTTTRTGLKQLDRGEVYDFRGQLGYGKACGILYISFIINKYKFSIGYDSEYIRNAIQNTTHYIIDAGVFPVIEDKKDSIYLQLSINNMGNLY